MPPRARLLFTDVDGTLVNARYRLRATQRQLERLAVLARIILVSSRTLDELRHLIATWGIAADCIAENGALIATRDVVLASALGASRDSDADPWYTHALAAPRDDTLAATQRALNAVGYRADPVDSLPPDAFASLSGYGVDEARRACTRRHAVLLRPLPMPALDALRHAGLQASFGGRWITVLTGADKGVAVQCYRDAWQSVRGIVSTIGVGDAPNDVPLLQAVQMRFVMTGPNGVVDPVLDAVPERHRLPTDDTDAWDAVLQYLERETTHV